MARVKVLESAGILAMDPGTTTGLAWGLIKLDEQDDMNSFQVVQRDLKMVSQVPADEGDDFWTEEFNAAKVIANKWLDLQFRWNMMGISYQRMFFVFEDFVLRPGHQHSSVRTGLSPVRITALVMGMLAGHSPLPNYVPQQPGTAMSKATNDRLKANKLWIPGMPHGMDALRHLCLWVSNNF